MRVTKTGFIHLGWPGDQSADRQAGRRGDHCGILDNCRWTETKCALELGVNYLIILYVDPLILKVLSTEYIFYCKRAIIFLSTSKILTPHPPLRPASLSSPRNKGGGYTLAGGRGGWGSIFWKTREIGLLSYSKICTLWYCPMRWIRLKLGSFDRSSLKSEARRLSEKSVRSVPNVRVL